MPTHSGPLYSYSSSFFHIDMGNYLPPPLAKHHVQCRCDQCGPGAGVFPLALDIPPACDTKSCMHVHEQDRVPLHTSAKLYTAERLRMIQIRICNCGE